MAPGQTPRAPRFNVLAFSTGRHDLAHISFVDDANRWFPATARRHNFRYESTTDWTRLNADSLNRYQVVVFLDTRPDNAAERDAFRRYMERGGAWLGFHFSAFALTPSDYPQNWDWYHNEFLGAGQYMSNTWRPTSAVLRVDAPRHPVVAGLPRTFDRLPTSHTAGSATFGRRQGFAFCSRSIPPAFRSGQARSRTRFGTAATIRSSGPTRIRGWST